MAESSQHRHSHGDLQPCCILWRFCVHTLRCVYFHSCRNGRGLIWEAPHFVYNPVLRLQILGFAPVEVKDAISLLQVSIKLKGHYLAVQSASIFSSLETKEETKKPLLNLVWSYFWVVVFISNFCFYNASTVQQGTRCTGKGIFLILFWIDIFFFFLLFHQNIFFQHKKLLQDTLLLSRPSAAVDHLQESFWAWNNWKKNCLPFMLKHQSFKDFEQ